jgi:hypothetical protein
MLIFNMFDACACCKGFMEVPVPVFDEVSPPPTAPRDMPRLNKLPLLVPMDPPNLLVSDDPTDAPLDKRLEGKLLFKLSMSLKID